MWLYTFVVLALVGFPTQAFEQGKLEMSFKRGLEDYLKTGQKSDELEQALDVLQLPQLFRTEDERGLLSRAACLACNVGVNVVMSARRHGAQKETLTDILEKLCTWLHIETEPICHGVVTAQADSIVYIIDNKEDLTSKRACSILLQGFGCQDPDRTDWEIEIPPWTGVENSKKISESKSLKVLQISDIHYDPAYTAGSNGGCDEPLCCQAGSKPSKPNDTAGFWGDYRDCDTPWHAYTDCIDHIVAQHKDLDFVYFTGDIINHKIWDTNVLDNTEAIIAVLQHLKDSFGSTTVYPILGNHEPHPVNLFSSDGVNEPELATQWVYDLAAEQWQTWLPAETRDTILRGGYYSVLVKPGFRVIALNSNVCYNFNWWLLYNDVDPYGQLQWLAETLSNAEQNGEIVHILSHVPPGDASCLQNWSREFTRIINRFAHIVAAQFNGHTHTDDTVVFFNITNPAEAINVAFNGGSITTYSNLNPNYKIYDVDSTTMEVLDFESWAYNLTEANLTPDLPPNWFKLYSFKDAYGVDNLSPQEIALLAERMAKDRFLTDQYFRFKHRNADTALAKGCNDKCTINNLCYMVTYHADQNIHCEILTEIYNSANQKFVEKLT